MMVVPVLITSCHVSENLNIGPVIPQTSIMVNAMKNVTGLPVSLVMFKANRSKIGVSNFFSFFFIMIYLRSKICKKGIVATQLFLRKVSKIFQQGHLRFNFVHFPKLCALCVFSLCSLREICFRQKFTKIWFCLHQPGYPFL